MDTVVLPTPPTSGAILSSGYGRKDGCVEELITLGALHNGQISTLNAVANGTRDTVKAIGDASRDNIDATNRVGIAGIKETGDVGRDNIRETSRAGSDNIRETARGASENLRETARVGADLSNAVSESRAAIERTNLNTAIASGEIRELIGTTSMANINATNMAAVSVTKSISDAAAAAAVAAAAAAIAAKDIQISIASDGCKTRETILAESCKTREVLGTQIWNLEKETLKGLAESQYKALENKCELSAQNAALNAKVDNLREAICCCIDKSAAEANAKRLESALLDAKFAALGNCGNNSGPGNSGK